MFILHLFAMVDEIPPESLDYKYQSTQHYTAPLGSSK